MALSQHYKVFHGIANKTPICDYYPVTFIEKPSFDFLDTCADQWLKRLKAQINIQSMIFLHMK